MFRKPIIHHVHSTRVGYARDSSCLVNGKSIIGLFGQREISNLPYNYMIYGLHISPDILSGTDVRGHIQGRSSYAPRSKLQSAS